MQQQIAVEQTYTCIFGQRDLARKSLHETLCQIIAFTLLCLQYMPYNRKYTIGIAGIALYNKRLVLGERCKQIRHRNNRQMQHLGIFYLGIDTESRRNDKIHFTAC